MENIFFDEEFDANTRNVHILIIFDIVDNKRRYRFVKFILGFAIRVQKSAFEAIIDEGLYRKILKQIPKHIDENEDSVRVYKIIQKAEVSLFGKNTEVEEEELIII